MKIIKLLDRFKITEGRYSILVEREGKTWTIKPDECSESFYFIYSNTEETRKKWKTVAKLIVKATELMEDMP